MTTVSVKRDGRDLVSIDGSRRFVVYGDIEWGWWIEVLSDGTEVPGLWEFDGNDRLVVRACE